MDARYIFIVFTFASSIGGKVVSGTSTPPRTAVCDVCDCVSRPHRGDIVNCTGRHLTQLPELIPNNFSVLILTDNNLTSIPEDALVGIESLTELFIEDNSLLKLPKFPKTIQKIEAGNNRVEKIGHVLRNLSSIASLKLSGNKITKLRDGDFNGLSHVGHLDLGRNQIQVIEPHTFRGLDNMITIDVSYNLLENLSTNAFDLNQDSSLDIYLHDNAGLETLSPKTFDNCPLGTSIFLQDCGLKFIDKGVFDGCKNILTLDLSNNKIAIIHIDAFNDVDRIFFLNLEYNNLTRMSSAFHLCLIVQLLLNFNNITSLESHAVSSNTTIIVMLIRNEIENISTANFNGMKQLKVLMIAHNKIRHIDEFAFDGTNLTALYLYDNKLHDISQTAFQMTGRSNLAYLYIHGNPINTVHEESFTSVDIVYISCEQLQMLPKFLGENVTVHCIYDDGSSVTLKGLSNSVSEEKIIDKISGVECSGSPRVCMFCPRGTYGRSTVKEGNKCLECPPGGCYQDRIGYVKTGWCPTDYCQPCPTGTFSKYSGAKSKSDCLACPEGTQTNSSARLNACDCLPMFHRVDRYGPCVQCPREGVNCSGGYQQPEVGYWWSWDFASTCDQEHLGSLAEYDAFISGLKNDTFNTSNPDELKDVVYGGSIPSIHRCPRSGSCKPNGTSVACADGYEGWMCVVCKRGYYSLFYECYKCPRTTALILMFSFVIILTILLASLALKYQKVLRRNYDKLKVNSLTLYIKIAINYYQIIGILSIGKLGLSSSGNIFIYLDIVGYINLLSPRCVFHEFIWDAYKQAILSICVPVAIITVGFVIAIIIKIIWRRNADTNLPPVTTNAVFSVVLLLLYFTYASSCTGIMAIGPWAYHTFNVTPDGHCTQTVINTDYSIIVTNKTNYKPYTLLCYISLVYVAGFPILIGCILFNHRRRGITSRRRQSYRPILDTRCSVNHSLEDEYNEDGESDDGNADIVVNDRTNVPDVYAQQQSLSFFYAQYTPRCWFWEVLEICTKAALAFIVNYEGYEGADVAYSILVIVLLVLLHVHFRPIKNTLAQRFQITTLVFVVVNLSVNSILSSYMDNYSPTKYMTSDILNCINASVVVVAIVAFIQTFFRVLIRKWVKNFTSRIGKLVYHRNRTI